MTQLLSAPASDRLSPIQQANWFLAQFSPAGVSDKQSLALQLSGSDPAALQAIWQQLVARHPGLRTLYREDRQDVRAQVPLSFRTVDAASWSEEEFQRNLQQYAIDPFVLEREAGLRLVCFLRSAERIVLLITLHQLAGDRDSLLWLVEEFYQCHQGSPTLPEPPPSYLDSVGSEAAFLESDAGQRARQFWREKLGGELPILDFPSPNARPTVRTYNGARCGFSLDAQLVRSLREFATAAGTTPNFVVLAAFKVLLHRFTRETDILVGVEGDRDGAFAGTIGNFSNLLVLRDEMVGTVSFDCLLQQILATATEAEAYRAYPFSCLIQDLQAAASLNRSPVCQAAFRWRSLAPLARVTQLLAAGTLSELPLQKAEFDLTLEVLDLGADCWQLAYIYNRDLVGAETIAGLGEQLRVLLAGIVADSQQEIALLPLLPEGDGARLQAWNQTQKDYDLSRCLHQWIEACVARCPEAVAVSFEGRELTYSELNARANQLANYLQKLGIGPDVLVGICADRSLEMVVGLLGILKAGGAYVPIDPNYPEERVAYLIDDARAPVLLTQRNLVDRLPIGEARAVCLDRDWPEIAAEATANLPVATTPESLAYVIYTSGSTGKPKGAMNAHRGICNRLLWMQDEYGLGPGDRVLQKTPFSFDVSVWEFFWPLMVGATLIVAKPGGHQDSSYLVETIAREGITTLHFVPSMLQIFLEAAGLDRCTALQRVICSGEALPLELTQRFFSTFDCELHNLYGPTEAAIDVTSWQCQPHSSLRSVPIGYPIANIAIHILDERLQPLPIGAPGELHIGGVGVARGYRNRPDLTAAKFISDPFCTEGTLYKTGDLARFMPDGAIEYLGRIDHQVKIRGFRIELGEIENTLCQHGQVRECVVVARTPKTGGKQLVAYFVASGEDVPTPQQLRSYLKDCLPEHMVPAAFVGLEALPLTPNGKVNRRALPAPELASFNRSDRIVAPRNETETQLVQLWSELLEVEPISVDANFFELGGHSLLAIKLMSQIQQRFGKNLQLATLFTSPTIAELAEVLAGNASQQLNLPIVPIQPKGSKQPFFCIHPAGGHVLCYVGLSRYLGKDRPFYGLQASGFNPGEEARTSVEAMAADYARAIQEFYPEGPYQIGGWSFGGVVAYETAQQLRAAGREVSLLALLDSYVPILLDNAKVIDDVYLVGVLSRVFGGMFGLDNLVEPEELDGKTVPEKIDYIIDKARKVGIFPPDVEQQQNRRILDVLVGTIKATYAYERRPYPGKVTVFRAREKHVMAPDPTLVWVELFSVLAAAEIEIVDVPGHHYSFVLEPHVRTLAQRLGARLDAI